MVLSLDEFYNQLRVCSEFFNQKINCYLFGLFAFWIGSSCEFTNQHWIQGTS